jgi:hypothetical protein
MKARRSDNLFTMALMLTSIIAVAELQYVVTKYTAISDIKYYFWVLTYPLVVLIFAWIMKELVQRKKYRSFSIFLTEFCWYLWVITIYLFLNYFFMFLVGLKILMWILLLTPFGLLIFYIRTNYKRIFPLIDYFKSWSYSIIALSLAIILLSFYTQFHFH